MKLKDFIKNNRDVIDAHIAEILGKDHPYKTDTEKRLWLMQDYDLRLWAIKEGVRI